MPALHDALGHRCRVGRARRRCRPGRRAGRTGRARRARRARRRPSSTPHPSRRWTGSNVTSATSPAGCPTTTGCGSANGSAGNGSCAAGPTARAGCATPTSRSIPKPTPGCPRRWTRPIAAERAAGRRRRVADVRSAPRRRLRHARHRRPQPVTAGRPRCRCSSTTTRSPTACTTTPCARRPTGSPSRPRRSAASPATPPSCRPSSTRHGAVLDQGRGRRVASADQRRALRAMYRTCGFPDCTVRFADCEIHHVIAWIRRRGPTDLDNLLPLCSRHHHDVHEGGWHLTLHPDRTITLHHPDGTLTYDGSDHRRRPHRSRRPRPHHPRPHPHPDPHRTNENAAA